MRKLIFMTQQLEIERSDAVNEDEIIVDLSDGCSLILTLDQLERSDHRTVHPDWLEPEEE